MDGLDTPKAIIRGTYMEIRAFELAYHRIRGRLKITFDGGWQDRDVSLEGDHLSIRD